MHNEPLVRSESTRKKAPSRSGVPNYSVVKGHPVEGHVFPPRNPTRDQPHYHIHIVGGPDNFDVAVNVLSSDDSQVLFHLNTTFRAPKESALLALAAGLTGI